MSRHLTRRQALAYGAAAGGLIAGAVGSSGQKSQQNATVEKGPGREPFWEPGPNKNLVRDLTPGPMTVRLAGYLGFDKKTGPGEMVTKIRDQGFTASIATADDWMAANDSQVKELLAACAQHDLVIFEVGGYRNLLHTVEASRQENLKRIAQCLETAERINCKMVGTISGSRNPEGNQWADNYAVHPDNWTMETWQLLISGLRQILKDTAGLKAAIGMEAQVTTNLDGPLAHKRLIEDVGDPRIKVNFDPTNMVHLSNHFHTTELINQCFDLLGEDIYGCHAKDSYVLPHEQTVHVQEVCPGRGSLDYETYLVRLSRMKWARALLPEHIPQVQMPEAYAYIRKVAEKVGVKIHG